MEHCGFQLGEITQAKTLGQHHSEQRRGFRVASELGAWEVSIRPEGRLDPDAGSLKCKADKESGLFCRAVGRWQQLPKWEGPYQSRDRGTRA